MRPEFIAHTLVDKITYLKVKFENDEQTFILAVQGKVAGWFRKYMRQAFEFIRRAILTFTSKRSLKTA